MAHTVVLTLFYCIDLLVFCISLFYELRKYIIVDSRRATFNEMYDSEFRYTMLIHLLSSFFFIFTSFIFVLNDLEL